MTERRGAGPLRRIAASEAPLSAAACQLGVFRPLFMPKMAFLPAGNPAQRLGV